jgi:hypothetical protein
MKKLEFAAILLTTLIAAMTFAYTIALCMPSQRVQPLEVNYQVCLWMGNSPAPCASEPILVSEGSAQWEGPDGQEPTSEGYLERMREGQ